MWGIFETNFKEIYFQIEQQKKKSLDQPRET